MTYKYTYTILIMIYVIIFMHDERMLNTVHYSIYHHMYHTICKVNGNVSNLQFIMTTTNKSDLTECTQKISGTYLCLL